MSYFEKVLVVQKLLLKAVYETQMLVFTKVVGLREEAPHKSAAKNHAGMTAKCIIDFYPGRPFHIAIADFDKVAVHLPKHQNVGEATKASAEIVHNKDER